MSPSRRTLLKASALTSAAAILPSWLAGTLFGATETPLVRYDVNGTNPEARAAVAAYRKGVAAMKARPAHDPTSWLFQANIHSWPGQFGRTATDPMKEFRDTFSPEATKGLSPEEKGRREKLAQTVWGTCTHNNPMARFLPWHRVYLFLFERIVRAAAGLGNSSNLGLPYWNWTKDRALPIAFREKINGSQDQNPLFWSLRDAPVNQLSNPDQIDAPAVDVTTILDQGRFSATLDAVNELSFSDDLEGGPHGNVHVWVKTPPRGMGFFEEAARDPIFWPHHCNIDRLWAHWSRGLGHVDPADVSVDSGTTWGKLGQAFVDVDGRERTLTTEQILVAAQILDRGYVYDDLPTTAVVASAANSSGAEGRGPSLEQPHATLNVVAKSGPVTVSSRTTVQLALPGPDPGLSATEDQTPSVLVLKDIRVDDTNAAAQYGVYLNLPEGTEPDSQGPYFAGTFNILNALAAGRTPAVPPGGESRALNAHAAHQPVNRSLPVGAILKRQQQSGLWRGGNLSVTLAPLRDKGTQIGPQTGVPATNTSGPTIGAFELLGR